MPQNKLQCTHKYKKDESSLPAAATAQVQNTHWGDKLPKISKTILDDHIPEEKIQQNSLHNTCHFNFIVHFQR